VTDSSDVGARALAVQFLQQLLQDREQGRVRSLEEYQRMFPGDPETVAEEFDAVMRPDADGADEHGDARYGAAERIGSGGMGVVECVFDSTLERPVARKRIGDGVTVVTDVERIARFHHEARVMARLQHPGIVPVFDLGVDEHGRAFFTMPVLDGDNLAQVVARLGEDAGWTRMRLVEVLARVAEAVAHAHQRGVVHRDLKPANVMVGAHGEAFVVDWGVARVLGAADPAGAASGAEAAADGLTRDGDVVGTPAYMAPEQAAGARDRVDRRSDVYALGAMLYHVLSGEPPYHSRGDQGSGERTRERVLAGPPTSVVRLCPDAPAELVSICERAMQREPSDRYADAAEFAADLRAFLEHRVVQAYRTGTLAELSTWIRRNRLAAVACLLAMAALVTGAVVTLQQKEVADENAQIAEQNFDLAFDAAEGLLVEFGLHALASDPAIDDMRRAMAVRARRYYERFLELRRDDPRVADKVALSHLRIALLEGRLGNAEAANVALERARSAYLQLQASGAAGVDCREQLAQIEIEQNLVRLERGETDAAIDGLERAAETARQLLEERPDARLLAISRAVALHNLAMALVDGGEHDRALDRVEQKIALTEALFEASPQLPRVHEIHASGHMLRGTTLQTMKRVDEAVVALERATELLRASLQRFPNNRGLRARYAEVLNLYAVAALNAGKGEDAGHALLKAIEVGRRLVAANPNVRDFQGNLGGALCNLSVLAKNRRDFENALGMLLEARVHMRRALEIDPGYRAFRRFRRIVGMELATVSMELGRYRDTGRYLLELVREQPGEHDWRAAQLLARCSARCRVDRSLAEPERSQLVDGYAKAAVQHLRFSVKRGTFQKDRIGDEVFAPLRGMPEFQKLLEEHGG